MCQPEKLSLLNIFKPNVPDRYETYRKIMVILDIAYNCGVCAADQSDPGKIFGISEWI